MVQSSERIRPGTLISSRARTASSRFVQGGTTPFGLGWGRNGFARDADTRVSIPALAFAVWYGRVTDVPGDDAVASLLSMMNTGLNLSSAESEAVFVDMPMPVEVQAHPLSQTELYDIITEFPGAMSQAKQRSSWSLNRSRSTRGEFAQ